MNSMYPGVSKAPLPPGRAASSRKTRSTGPDIWAATTSPLVGGTTWSCLLVNDSTGQRMSASLGYSSATAANSDIRGSMGVPP